MKEVLKYFLIHEDPLVRDSVGFHFFASFSPDKDLIPLVLEACERYGELSVLNLLGFACRFLMSHRGIEETLRVLDRSHPPFLDQWLAMAPLELVAPRKSLVADVLSERALSRLARRGGLEEISLQGLWSRLELLADKLDRGRGKRGDWDEADDLLEALARRERSSTVLAGWSPPKESVSLHRALFDVELAGAMGLQESTPRLLDLLGHEEDALAEAASRSLARFRNPGTIRLLRERYTGGSWRFRRGAISVMKAVELEVAEKALRSLLEIEGDPELRGEVFDALRFHFSSPASATLREEIRRPTSSAPKEELKKAVFVLSRVLGIDDPKAERWRKRGGPGADEILFHFPVHPPDQTA